MAEATLDPAATITITPEADNNSSSDLDNTAAPITTAGADEEGQDELASLVAPERNHAPGIPDRRKSVRPSERSKSKTRGKGKTGKQVKEKDQSKGGERLRKTPDIQVSMAEEGKIREDDVTPGEKEVRACSCGYWMCWVERSCC